MAQKYFFYPGVVGLNIDLLIHDQKSEKSSFLEENVCILQDSVHCVAIFASKLSSGPPQISEALKVGVWLTRNAVFLKKHTKTPRKINICKMQVAAQTGQRKKSSVSSTRNNVFLLRSGSGAAVPGRGCALVHAKHHFL